MISRILLLFLCMTMASDCCGDEPNHAEQGTVATPIVKGPTGRPLSPAMQRAYRDWPAADDRSNEFFTNFKYSRLNGIGKDPYVSRRDPSKVIKHDGKYYVWYTRRETVSHPVGIKHGTDKFPALDWDQVGKYNEETFFHTRTIMDPNEKQKAIEAGENEFV